MLERVVIVLAIIFDRDRFAQIAQLDHDLRIVFINLDRSDVFDNCFDFFQDIRYQNRVISRKKAARFLNDRRMRNVFIVADLLDGVDDVIGKLLGAVVSRRIKCRL